MKKLIVLLALLLPLLLPAQNQTQELEGTWTFHPTYQMNTATNLIDTEHFVYALTNGALVRWDKVNEQVMALSSTNGLSDVKVKDIYYNYDKRYLLVTYANSNIDLLYEDGRIVNISALHDAVMNISRAINDVTFTSGKALIATDFGMVVLNDSTLHVSEFRNYNKALTSVAQVGEYLVVAYGGSLYASSSRRESLSDFMAIGVSQEAARLYPANDSTFFLMGTGALKRCDMDPDGRCDVTTIYAATPNNIQQTVGGWLANFRANSRYYTIKNDSTYAATEVSGNSSSLYSCTPNGDGTVWQIDGNGIHIKGNTAYHKPEGIYLRSAGVTLFHNLYNTWDNTFYVTTADQNALITSNFTHVKHILNYDGNSWVDTTPAAIKNTSKLAKITFIPGHPGSYFATDRSNTFYRVINGVVNGTFKNGNTNTPLQYGSMSNSLEPGLMVDPQGNLWMMSSAGNNVLAMLPSEKVLADTVRYSDWVLFDISKFDLSYPQRQQFVATRDGVKVFTNGYQNSLFNIWRTKPNAADITDIDLLVTHDFIDQNGKAIDMKLPDVYAIATDSTDHVWIGMRPGLFYFKASEVFEPNFRATKPAATEGEEDPYNIDITAIGVDPFNRKWIGTKDNGLYVVSPDGSKVLNHFDVDNSAMPSSLVYGVSASAERAIVTTASGIVEFNMNDIPNVIDYTAVTATPTFVEPGYTGFVTIGQVDVGAFVRITDSDGNVVREFTATSGQVAWDTCDDTGERVPTGVYSIYAGLTAEQLPGTPQVRVRVIK
ncbi:MAG: hypothetical protein IKX39_07950 [Muribaculaceae bacterium]|nr:hypothetical protein [Muribaculaceae bacterium]